MRVIKSQKIPLGYTIQLPELAPIAERLCIICGRSFIPKTAQVRTCGRTCGSRSRSQKWRSVLEAPPQPLCPDCGRPSSGLRQCRACRSHHGTAQAILRRIGVLGNKHVPMPYLRASEAQRRALLAGLLDTDGTVTSTGSVQFSVTSQRLAADVRELLMSLGYRCGWSEKRVPGANAASSVAYTITFTTTDDVFRLERKRVVHRERHPQKTRARTGLRFISAVRPIDSVAVRCVQVDSADHMYLASRSMIPTHNSTLALDFARAAAIKHNMATVLFSLEMGRNEITMRLLSAESRVPLQTMRTGPDERRRLGPAGPADERGRRRAAVHRRLAEHVDDGDQGQVPSAEAAPRPEVRHHRLPAADVLPPRVENRQQEVSDLSRSLKLLAKELDVPVVALSQLNRGPSSAPTRSPCCPICVKAALSNKTRTLLSFCIARTNTKRNTSVESPRDGGR
jgi:replicative DNA helicase